MFGFGGPTELAIVAVIVVILFGSRLPSAAKSLGQSFGSFKKGLKDGATEDQDDKNDPSKLDSSSGPTF